jgi:uncharacterized protein
VVSGTFAAALVEWREKVAAIYREVREAHGADAQAAWLRFCQRRNHLYKHHPCSALPEGAKARFHGFDYHAYNPQYCFDGQVDYDVAELPLETETSEGTLSYRRIGVVRFPRRGAIHSLDLYWLDIYGGGLWLPIGDDTNGLTSYGGGRYLFDTAKGANLGIRGDGKNILLDLNFLYSPSCALNEAWICPLCPPANRLFFEVNAGERNRADCGPAAINACTQSMTAESLTG